MITQFINFHSVTQAPYFMGVMKTSRLFHVLLGQKNKLNYCGLAVNMNEDVYLKLSSWTSAWGSSAGFSRVSPTKVEARKSLSCQYSTNDLTDL